MRILIYGFGPYKQFHDNICEKIIRALPSLQGVRTAVFPVRFNRRQFIDALERHRPDKLIGLGQCTRARIELETRALNRKRTRTGKPVTPIRKNGPESLGTTLEMKLGRIGKSDDAGDYVCNYSIYVMLEYVTRRKFNWAFYTYRTITSWAKPLI